MVALTEVTASLGAILAATIPLWVVLLSWLVGTRVSVASQVRLAAGFGGIAIVVLTAPGSAIRRGAVGGRGILRRAGPVGRGEPADCARRPTG